MKKILVVDFDARSRLDVPCDWAEITTAAGMQEAMALTRTRVYDIIVAAARIPGGSCVELFTTLHRNKVTARFIVMRNGPFDRDRIHSGHGLAIIPHPFTLDDLAPYVDDAREQASFPPTYKRSRVLIVHQDALYQEQVVKQLIKHRCDTASSLKEAIAMSTSANPQYDAILCDVSLPDGEDGLGITTLVNSSEAPVICCSSNTQYRAFSLQNGAQAFVERNDFVGISGTVDLAIEQAQHTRLLRELALTDARTGLMGWTSFRAEIANNIANAEVHKSMFAVAVLDLDHFKAVNDTYGHDMGDVMISEVASRIKVAAQHINGIPSRIAGDEFGIILSNIRSPSDAKSRIDLVISKVNKSVDLGLAEWTPSCSSGISLYPKHGTSVKALLESADQSAYEAKKQGRNRSFLCTDEIVTRITQSREVSRNLTTSTQTMNGFSLVYQPIVDLASGNFSLEALLRWDPPCGNKVPPDVFIPLLERNGHICQVGKWVLAHALKDFADLRRIEPALQKININVSVVQLMDSHFPDFLQILLKSYQIQPKDVGLELTESEKLITDTVAHSAVVELHDLGYHWTLDDFGTGYASVKYIEDFPFRAIKIDRSIVTQKKIPSYVKGIVSFSHTLDLKVVAEGVETEEQFRAMREAGVDHIQGYYLGRPMPSKEVIAWWEACQKRLPESLRPAPLLPIAEQESV